MVKNAFFIILVCFVLAVLFFKYILGAPEHFVNGDPTQPVKDGNLMGTVYKGGVVVPVIITLLFSVIALSIERFFALRTAFGKSSLGKFVINEVGEQTVKDIEAFGHKVKAYASNAANFEETHNVVNQILADFGRIDILVNNAGITKDRLMLRMSEAQWDAVLNVNLKSAFNFIHALTPIMARQRSGSIINMSSVVGVSGNAGQCNYSASKAGLIGLAKSIAKEMGPRGIRANCIAPGFIISDMTNALSEEVRDAWVKQIPLRRGGTPEDVANVAVFLASDLSSYVSGQVIHCCGAMNC